MTLQKTAALISAAPDNQAPSVLARSRGSSDDRSLAQTSSVALSRSEPFEASRITPDHGTISRALVAIHTLAETLVSPIRSSSRTDATDHHTVEEGESLAKLSQLLGSWRIPKPPLEPLQRRLSLDDSLLRYELAWIHLACVKLRPSVVDHDMAHTARRFEEMLDQKFNVTVRGQSPFTGLIQAIEIARATGHISEADSDTTLKSAFACSQRDDAWRILRVTVQSIAATCGFPRWTSTPVAAA